MLEIIEGIFKGFAILLRLFVEGGLLDVSISATGRFFMRLFYPLHWFKKGASYPLWAERTVGVIAWLCFCYLAFYVDYSLPRWQAE